MKTFSLPNGEICYCIDKFTALESYNEIYNDREYDKFGLEIKDGDVVFDVGANIGIFSRYISTIANNLTIYTFEPVPVIFKTQKKNLELIKNAKKIHPHNIGLGNKEGSTEINFYPRATTVSAIVPIDFELEAKNYVEHWNQMMSSTMPIARFVPKFLRKSVIKLAHKFIYKAEKIPIKIRTLSDIIKENNVKSIDFLKMDAENYEREILQGLSETDWKLIKQIAMEVHTNIVGGGNILKEITKLLESKGFTVNHDLEGRFAPTGVYMLYAKK